MSLTTNEEAILRELLEKQSELLSLADSESTIVSKLGGTLGTIADLTSATAIADTDTLLVNQDGVGKKIAWSVARQFYNLTYSGTLTGGTGVVNIGSGQIYKDASGNVGIGTSSPAYKLSIQAGVGGGLNMTNGVDSTLRVLLPTSGITYNNVNGGYHAWQVSGSEHVRIDNSGRVGIGTSSPSASAILDAQSTTKGVRMPNMTTAQKNAIASPAAGLMVFDTTLAKMCVYTGVAWQTMTSA